MSVIKIKDVPRIIGKLREEGKKIVVTNGCFDVLHIGHLRYLSSSKSLGDLLVVGVNSDESIKALKGPKRPINSEKFRAELVDGLKPVDYVVIFNELDACEFLRISKPDLYTKGGDYSSEELEKWPEYKLAKEMGIEIRLVDFVEDQSSTKIIKQIYK
jgi:D-glycero-beta-D-manno-heptose 1-phosphate adenylyltransferase